MPAMGLPFQIIELDATMLAEVLAEWAHTQRDGYVRTDMAREIREQLSRQPLKVSFRNTDVNFPVDAVNSMD